MPVSKSSPVTVCTLWEHDHHKGVATLANSLARNGYRGRVWAGYRGEIPSWASPGSWVEGNFRFQPDETIEIVFIKLDPSIHFAQYKPAWMLRILEELEPDAAGIFYFDPDIFVVGNWKFYEKWIEYGIAACEDVAFPFNPRHPLTRSWEAYARQIGYSQWNPADAYFNSGLVGVRREVSSFLTLWTDVMNAIRRDFGKIEGMRTHARTDTFHRPGQDGFTLATYITEHPISWVGPDGMAFDRGEWLTVHSYLYKPWRARVMRDLLVYGRKPDRGTSLYWEMCDRPIKSESQFRMWVHRLLIPFARLVSRFYGLA